MPQYNVLITINAYVQVECEDITGAREKVQAMGRDTVLNEAVLEDYEIFDVEVA